MKLKNIRENVVNIKPTTDIRKILAWPIKGNAYHDQKLMDAIHKFVTNTKNAMADKIKAIEKLDQVMGEKGTVTAADVDRYIADE